MTAVRSPSPRPTFSRVMPLTNGVEAELQSADADVIAVLELSSGLRKHLANVFQHDYPFSLVDSQDNGNFGIGLYSRYEFESAKLTYFNDESIQSIVACSDRQRATVSAYGHPRVADRSANVDSLTET